MFVQLGLWMQNSKSDLFDKAAPNFTIEKYFNEIDYSQANKNKPITNRFILLIPGDFQIKFNEHKKRILGLFSKLKINL